MPTRALNTPHMAPDVFHQIYPYVLWWVTDLVAIPQQKFSVGSTADDKIPKVLAQEAPRVLEASTLLLRGEQVVGHVMDLASPPWAPASILALHLASGLRDPLSMCSPQELLRTPRVAELSLVVLTAAGGMELGGFLVDDSFSPPPASSTVRTTRELRDNLVDGDSVPIYLLSQFEAAIQPGLPERRTPNYVKYRINIVGLARPYGRLRMCCSQRIRTSSKRSYITIPVNVCSLELMIYKSRLQISYRL